MSALNGFEIALCLGALFSFVGVCLMGWDKRQARKEGRRVSERTLYGVMIIGGAAGVKMGQILFQHKTRKQPIATLIVCALIWNAALLGYIAYETFLV